MTRCLDVSTAPAQALAPSREGQGQGCETRYIHMGSPFFGLEGAQEWDFSKGAVEQWGCAWGHAVPVDAHLLILNGVHQEGIGCGHCRD